MRLRLAPGLQAEAPERRSNSKSATDIRKDNPSRDPTGRPHDCLPTYHVCLCDLCLRGLVITGLLREFHSRSWYSAATSCTSSRALAPEAAATNDT